MKRKNQVKETERGAAADAPKPNGHEEKTARQVEPAREEIAALAYALWTSREPNECSAEEDWYRAEEQLRGSTILSSASRDSS